MIRDAKVLEAYLRELLDSLPDASFVVDSTGRLVLVNSQTEEMSGHQSGELQGKPIDTLIPERFQHAHAGHCSDYFARPRARAMGVGLSLSALRKDGTEFPVEISLSPIETNEGTFVLGVIRDISQSEERYRAIFGQVEVGIVHSNLEGRILNVNPKFCEISGYTREEALALDIHKLTHPGDISSSIEARTDLLTRAHSAYEKEVRLFRRDGTEIWAHITTSLVRGADGRPIHFISVLHDISSQKHAEEQQHETELRFRQVTENIREVFWLTDPSKDEVLYVSPAYEEIWGRSRAAAYSSPRDWVDAIHPEDRDRVLDAARTKQITRGYDEEYRVVRPDGSVRWIRDRAFPVQDEHRRVIRVAGVAEDITEHKQAADELRESEERFRAMIEQSISGTCIIDAEGRFAYVNPRLTAILGHESAASITGRPVFDFVVREDQALVAERLRQRVAGEIQSARYQFRAIRKDGSYVTLGAHGTIGSYAGGQVVIATVQDVTELRRAEEEVDRTVAKLRRALESTIAVISSIGELRDPHTYGHERRVGELATAIAAEMTLSAECIEGIRVAAYLHDLGKIAVPADILVKPARLSPAEFELVKGHAQQSYEILKGVEFPWPVAEAVWQHHERLDGSGYPRGLKGEEIILEARVLAVADTVEAMASHRPYRPSLGVDVALAEIESNRTRLFDPDVVDACLQLFRVKGYRIPA